ncbi:MAG TPA: hypothetical protein VK960_00940 [Acidimicrobiia bacterium]|nr:hypothetical protein [Acidimicrobiia bacterium]
MDEKRKILLIVALVVAGALVLAAPVAAKRKPDKPTPTTTVTTTTVASTTTNAPAPTTTSSVGAPSCFERVREMGATAWAYDPIAEADTQWDGSAYVQTGIPACVDVDQPGHTSAVTWEVTWDGGVTARPIKGIKLVFEAGVHGTVYAEQVSDLATCNASNDCSWTVTIDPGGVDPLVLVAMPRSGDRWTAPPTFTVTPLAP